LSLKIHDILTSTIVLGTLVVIVNKVLLVANPCQKAAVDPVGGLVNTCAGVVTLIDASSMVLLSPKSPPSQATLQKAKALDALGAQILIEMILKDPTKGCRVTFAVAMPPNP